MRVGLPISLEISISIIVGLPISLSISMRVGFPITTANQGDALMSQMIHTFLLVVNQRWQ